MANRKEWKQLNVFEKTIGLVGVVIIAIIAIFVLVAVVQGVGDAIHGKKTETKPVIVKDDKKVSKPSTPSQKPETKPTYVYDIPSFASKNIDQVRAILGTPQDKEPEPTQQQLSMGVDEWSNGYEKDGLDLTITFNPVSRKVTDYFLSGNNRDKLIGQGNLDKNSGAYKIESVESLRGSGITGIKIIPN